MERQNSLLTGSTPSAKSTAGRPWLLAMTMSAAATIPAVVVVVTIAVGSEKEGIRMGKEVLVRAIKSGSARERADKKDGEEHAMHGENADHLPTAIADIRLPFAGIF
jgi:hypothetical protein